MNFAMRFRLSSAERTSALQQIGIKNINFLLQIDPKFVCFLGKYFIDDVSRYYFSPNNEKIPSDIFVITYINSFKFCYSYNNIIHHLVHNKSLFL